MLNLDLKTSSLFFSWTFLDGSRDVSRSLILLSKLSIHASFIPWIYCFRMWSQAHLEISWSAIMGKSQNFERSNTTYFFIYYGGLIPLSYILYTLYITLYSAEQTYINKKICRCIDGTRLETRSITHDNRWDNSRRENLFISSIFIF